MDTSSACEFFMAINVDNGVPTLFCAKDLKLLRRELLPVITSLVMDLMLPLVDLLGTTRRLSIVSTSTPPMETRLGSLFAGDSSGEALETGEERPLKLLEFF